mmetsp:Transcript_12222/g.25603  ORF Transcript_12222/g.25603 Transcript_12222/m.25603 type:complete len:115 (-) Transcript_12222:163-507(-)
MYPLGAKTLCLSKLAPRSSTSIGEEDNLCSHCNLSPMKELLILAFQQIYWALIADLVGLGNLGRSRSRLGEPLQGRLHCIQQHQQVEATHQDATKQATAKEGHIASVIEQLQHR